MDVEMDKCDYCVLEAIKKDIPDYKLDLNYDCSPIWLKYHKAAQEKLCVCANIDDISESVCLDHLGLMVKP